MAILMLLLMFSSKEVLSLPSPRGATRGHLLREMIPSDSKTARCRAWTHTPAPNSTAAATPLVARLISYGTMASSRTSRALFPEAKVLYLPRIVRETTLVRAESRLRRERRAADACVRSGQWWGWWQPWYA